MQPLISPLLADRLTRGERVVAVGLMSGTSADGIDAAAVALWWDAAGLRTELLAFETVEYPGAVRDRLFRCFADRSTVSELCELNAHVGEVFADAAEAVARSLAEPLDFVASHGQTVWHQPPTRVIGRTGGDSDTIGEGSSTSGATLQIGEAARIAERLRVPVVCDFRQQDMALGGQGAPLVPYVDFLLFAHQTENRAVQNLGGIGNVSYLPAGRSFDAVQAFDTGPANAWIDAAVELASDGEQSYDAGGRLAASAPVNAEVMAELLREPFLQLRPPKSTGRELFTVERVARLWDAGCRGAELVSTLTQYTVETVALAYRRWLGPVDVVILGGGGARNPELVRRLAEALRPARVITHEEYGINGDAKEALAFAVLGYETLRGRPSNLPAATGAKRAVIQGKVCFP